MTDDDHSALNTVCLQSVCLLLISSANKKQDLSDVDTDQSTSATVNTMTENGNQLCLQCSKRLISSELTQRTQKTPQKQDKEYDNYLEAEEECLLLCGHYFCLQCFSKAIESSCCPVCLRRAVQNHELQNKKKKNDCESCLSRPAHTFCSTCFCTFCTECDTFFHSNLFLQRHSRLPALAPRKNLVLQLHCVCHAKPLEHFCLDCQVRVCHDCVTPDSLKFRTTGRPGGGIDGGEHIGHDYISLEQSLTPYFEEKINKGNSPLSEQLHIVKLLLQNVKHRVRTLNEEAKKAREHLTVYENKASLANDKRLKGAQEKENEEFTMSATARVDQEIEEMSDILEKRRLYLLQNVENVANEKVKKLLQQEHSLHEIHNIIFLLKFNSLQQLREGKNLLENGRDHYTDDASYAKDIAALVEWTSHTLKRSNLMQQLDINDEVGHLAAPTIPLHFPQEAPASLISFGTVDGPPPPEHLRCSMAQHDSFSQAVTLSWTSAVDVKRQSVRNVKKRLKKHRSGIMDVQAQDDENIDDFGSSSSETSENSAELCDKGDSSSSIAASIDTLIKDHMECRPNLLKRDDVIQLLGKLDHANMRLQDLETIEKDMLYVVDKPLQEADYHLVEMRVLGEHDQDNDNYCGKSHAYDQGREDFAVIAKVPAHKSYLNVDISSYPNSCIQFRIRGGKDNGVRGEYSITLSFMTPRVFRHVCTYNPEKGPFESSAGLFYWLGTGCGLHQYRNPLTISALNVWASCVESGQLRSVVSEGYDGDLVVRSGHSLINFPIPFLHPNDRSQGNPWVEIDISFGTKDDRDYLIIPEYYCIRSGSGIGGKPRSWALEGCREKSSNSKSAVSSVSGDAGDDWVLLKEHKHDNSLSTSHCSTAAWSLDSNTFIDLDGRKHSSKNKTRLHSNAFRYLRIVGTGNNSSGNRNLEMSGLEIYGTVVLVAKDSFEEE